jgi:hypothetical protein
MPGPQDDLGKKNDDIRPPHTSARPSALRNVFRVRRKRFLIFACAVAIIWFLFTHRLQDLLYVQYGDDLDLLGADDFSHNAGEQANSAPFTGKTSKPRIGSAPDKNKDFTKYYYDGPVKFFEIQTTIGIANRMGGYHERNRIVLFAAASLPSASVLIPMACELSKQTTSFVHMAFMGRNDLSIFEILRLNGVDTRTCRVYFHDGRPDFTSYSSDKRAESATAHVFKYIHKYLHPQALIVDSDQTEEEYFSRAVVKSAQEFNLPLIQIPSPSERIDQRSVDNLAWMSRLDPGSLSAWHVPTIHILIQAQTSSSGSLIQLLQALQKADYSGTVPPHITIELPSETDKVLNIFLSEFKWPPKAIPGAPPHITLRRRIPIGDLSALEASVRFMESFYPAHPDSTHVLLLSPNVHISPLYFQALRYYLLLYRHSLLPSPAYPWLMGISLSSPDLHLNGSKPFTPPTLFDLQEYDNQVAPVSPTIRPPFLWEAPSTDAALYFGPAWRELHTFLSLRLAAAKARPEKQERLVGTHMPSWSEFVLEYIRASGGAFLFLGAAEPSDAFAVVRPETDRTPDEFKSRKKGSTQDEADPYLAPSPLPSVPPSELSLHDSELRPPHAAQHLSSILPFRGPDPLLVNLPFISWSGEQIPRKDYFERTKTEAEKFRVDVGGCAAAGRRKDGVAGLFCWTT